MISFVSVEMHNFVCHKDTLFSVEDYDSVFIGGENQDARGIGSNGSGKSLIFDAIVWCLYDTTVRGFGKDEVIGTTDKYTSVKTTWRGASGEEIVVTRYRNHPKYANNAEILVDGNDLTKNTNSTEEGTNYQISNIIGLDSVGFLHSITFSRSRDSICEETSNNRYKLISHIMRLDKIDSAYKYAKKDKDSINIEISNNEIGLATLRTESSELVKRLDIINQHIDEADNASAKMREAFNARVRYAKETRVTYTRSLCVYLQALNGLKKKDSSNREVKQKINHIDEKILELKHRLNGVTLNVDKCLESLNTAKRSIANANKSGGTVCTSCKQIVSHKHVKEYVSSVESTIPDMQKEHDEYAAEFASIDSAIDSLIKEKIKLRGLVDDEVPRTISDVERSIYMCEGKIESTYEPIEIDLQEFITSDKSKVEYARLQNRVSQVNDSVVMLEKKSDELRERKSIAEFWVDGFGNSGMKKYIINSVLDILEVRANEYLDIMTDGYIKIRWVDKSTAKTEKLMLYVDTGNGMVREYHHSSDGEKARVWLAVELALNSISRVSVDVAFIDECFDGLDGEGLDRAISLIGNEGQYRKIVCISHRNGVANKFQTKKTVVMNNGVASIKAA